MSNTIRLNKTAPQEEWLNMSNGTTDTFLDLLVLAGSSLAKTNAEKEMVVWLSEHDQKYIGDGLVGFDIVEMPWQTAEFDRQKQFLIKTTYVAESGDFKEMLSYQPDMEYIKSYFRTFLDIVAKMSEDMVEDENRIEWMEAADNDDPVKNGFLRCEHHGILLSTFGCRLCGKKRAETTIK